MDTVFIVKRIMESCRTTRSVRRGSRFDTSGLSYNRTLYLMFEDFTKAFDSVITRVYMMFAICLLCKQRAREDI